MEERDDIAARCTPWLREKIEEGLKDKGLNQSKAADRLGVTRSAISQILSGRWRSGLLFELCRLAGVPEHYALPVSDFHRRAWSEIDKVLNASPDEAEDFVSTIERVARGYRK